MAPEAVVTVKSYLWLMLMTRAVVPDSQVVSSEMRLGIWTAADPPPIAPLAKP